MKRAKALLPPTPGYRDPPYIELPRLANAIAGFAMRKDGAARICEHAEAVVKLLGKWGLDKDDAALAWLLGILDVAETREEEAVIREEIRHATRETMWARGLPIVDGLRWGNPTHSWSGEEELIRSIAIADSICLVREWLGGDEKRRQMATWKHNASSALFEDLDKVKEVKYPGLFKERIPAEIASLQEERKNWGDELYCRRRGGIPVNPTTNETT